MNEWLFLGLGAGALYLMSSAEGRASGGGFSLIGEAQAGDALPAGNVALTGNQALVLAQNTTSAFNLYRANPYLLRRLWWIESSFRPWVSRFEPKLNESSWGLGQVLESTAKWLHGQMGYRAYEPTIAVLTTAQGCAYFSAAYVHYVANYKGRARGEEFILRSYNGGPHVNDPDDGTYRATRLAATDGYWSKYLAAKTKWG